MKLAHRITKLKNKGESPEEEKKPEKQYPKKISLAQRIVTAQEKFFETKKEQENETN